MHGEKWCKSSLAVRMEILTTKYMSTWHKTYQNTKYQKQYEVFNYAKAAN